MTKNKRLVLIFSALAVLAALIIINSAVFSVRIVHAHSLSHSFNNPEVERINTLIAQNHGIRTGTSIFMLNEQRTIENVRYNLIAIDELAHIEIRGIERLFPNRLMIHYVILHPMFYVEHNGEAFVFSNNATLIHIVSLQEARVKGAIGLRLRGALLSTELGDAFQTHVPADRTTLDAVMATMERINHRQFSYVDISNPGVISIQTQPGVRIEIRSILNFASHFAHAYSTYRFFMENDTYRYRTLGGRLLVIQTTGGDISVAYTPD